ncbi:8f20dfd1-0d21-4e6a-bf1c-d5615c4be60a [Sclerotinia trifoliorum]|uniref:8f20dfd1-0d21-4e6a-bf1c-d5615c4be60a n=1 Tax=Sclerotinia trifoliorum TaxID=28548 RepID=A0A8H2VXX1_9HELO|nr:8f20dfd1-0d21-4e6a-bf1c-d5615c4be60a [Sclerotinia trifoliorum]
MGDLEPLERDVEMAESKPMIGEDINNHKNEGKRKKSRASQILDIACIGLNIISTVVLVFLNKWIFKDPQLRNMQISFAMWHFTCTTIVLWLASRSPFNLFVPIRLPFLQMLPLCCFFAGFLILGNLSLAFNSVGFYQLAKIMTTPCVALLQYFFLSKSVSPQTILALASVCIGVALTNTGASGTTTFGASIAIAAFVVTAFYQVWIGKKLTDFKASSPQLLLNQAPISVLILAFLVPFFDTKPDVSVIPKDTLVALGLSGIAAALLNLSQFLIIGRMSALTFNVASNVKTIIILTYGWVSEGRLLTVKDSAGILLALGGATMYSQLSQR